MARLIGRIAIGQVLPWRAGAKNPQHAIEQIPSFVRRPSASIGPRLVAEEGFKERPLLVGEIHAVGTTVGARP